VLQPLAENGAIICDKQPDQLMAGAGAPEDSWKAERTAGAPISAPIRARGNMKPSFGDSAARPALSARIDTVRW